LPAEGRGGAGRDGSILFFIREPVGAPRFGGFDRR
jgi:hypothetical protein